MLGDTLVSLLVKLLTNMNCIFPIYLKRGSNGIMRRCNSNDNDAIACPCGQCLNCLINHNIEWTNRLVAESKQYKDNCMITLTYDDQHLPDNEELRRRDITLFIKRLRRKIEPVKIRYFYSAEYGSKMGRPHFHIIVFNYIPDDLVYWHHTKKNNIEYRSKIIEKLWTNGFSTVCTFSKYTAKYCAKYLQKLNYKLNDTKKVKPFVGMSLKPGIGANLLNEADFENDKIFVDSSFSKIPRYILKLKEKQELGLDFNSKQELGLYTEIDKLKLKRLEKMKLFENDNDDDFIKYKKNYQKLTHV